MINALFASKDFPLVISKIRLSKKGVTSLPLIFNSWHSEVDWLITFDISGHGISSELGIGFAIN